MPISFHKEQIEFQLPPEEHLTQWLSGIAHDADCVISQISYIFCSDEYLLDINKTYLDHDYYTDIITFPYKQGKEIESDIFISIDRIKENAQSYGVTFDDELLRVIAHGVLHMVGYGDKTDEQQIEMTKMENQALDSWRARIAD